MSTKRVLTPLQKVIKDIEGWIDKTEDEMAKYPSQAAKEIVSKRLEDEEIFAGKMYDYGASARYGYETGRKFFNDKIKTNGRQKSKEVVVR